MKIYFETSILVSLFVTDSNTPAAEKIALRTPSVITSVWAEAEFSSALGVRSRMRLMTALERSECEAAFNTWMTGREAPILPIGADFVAARTLVQQVRAPLRAADALHLALCQRLGLSLATLDLTQSAAAIEIGVPLG